jgi:ribosomal-protein-alanine N-acetyltransferase
MFSLRQFNPKELREVVDINLKTLPENYSPDFFLYLYRNFPKTFLVAEVDGKIVGYVMCRIEPNSASLASIRRGHVVSIAVLPEHRRKGIGSALMRKAMRGMLEYGASDCYLEVRVSNSRAINMYKKLGFRIERVAERYYMGGEDAYIMVKKLSDAEASP